LRTLIILDTNQVRSLSYGSFKFGSEFKAIRAIIEANELSEFIDLAVPEAVMQEVLHQKAKQYSDDAQDIIEIRNRLSELPGVDFSQVSLPDISFSCKEHLKSSIPAFIQSNGIRVIEIKEEKSGHILKELLRRALEERPPFRKNSDRGFKDVMIWESILNYGGYDNYDKVILLTGDRYFNEACEAEFKSKVKKKIATISSVELLQDEIEKDYSSEIQNKKWRGFTANDYFKNRLLDEASKLKYITIDAIDRKVTQVTVVNYFDNFEELEDSEESGTPIALVSSLSGTVEIEGTPTEVKIKARTFLDDTDGMQYTEFGVE